MAGPRLRVQSVLYHQSAAEVSRLVESVLHSAERGLRGEAFATVHVVLGDCSATPLLEAAEVEELRRAAPPGPTLEYRWFGENLGHGGGHEALARGTDDDLYLFVNPDAFVAPDALADLVGAFADPRCGVAEARQVPYEHPKAFDPRSGETPWSAFACAMVRGEAFRAVGGFDAATFFLHCDDVDLSWRLRLAGYRCTYRPGARVFHDRRPGPDGQIAPSAGEELHGALGLLLLARKYGFDDVAARLREQLLAGSEAQRRAVSAYDERVAQRRLPAVLDPDHRVAAFVGFDVSDVRF